MQLKKKYNEDVKKRRINILTIKIAMDTVQYLLYGMGRDYLHYLQGTQLELSIYNIQY